MPKPKKDQPKIEVEPGADKRLANILKRALNTPPDRRGKSSGKSTDKGGSRR